MYLRNVSFSSKYFGYYNVEVDIRYTSDKNDIINYCKNDLLNLLKEKNLVWLIDKLNESNFHIHTHTYEEILLLDNDDTIYICDCLNH